MGVPTAVTTVKEPAALREALDPGQLHATGTPATYGSVVLSYST